MKRAKIAELKDNLSRYLEHVEAGGEVVVLRRDRPVARIVPVAGPAASGDEARLADLERLGLARRGKRGHTRRWLRAYRPAKLAGGGLVAEFLEDRRSGW